MRHAFTLLNPGSINVSRAGADALVNSPYQGRLKSEYLDMEDRMREKLVKAFGVLSRRTAEREQVRHCGGDVTVPGLTIHGKGRCAHD